MGNFVVRENERAFKPVVWGQSKNIFSPENVGAKYMRIGITIYAPGTTHELHRHPEQEEVIFVLEGEGITRTEDGDKQVSPGAFVFVPAGVDHATINVLKDKPMKAIIIKAPPQEGSS